MSLALRLNELAQAHEQGLVNDDEYRLLRQSLFEQYSTEPAHARGHIQQPTRPLPQTPQPPPPSQSPLRRKPSVVSNVANLFRKATGRSSRKQPTTDALPASSLSPQEPTPAPSKRINRKPSLLNLLRSDSSQQHASLSSMPEQQDDITLLRNAIASTEAEHTRLLEAFDSLHASTLKRIQYKTARRLFTPPPNAVDVLLQGREWRKHTEPVPSIILPPHTASSPTLSRSTSNRPGHGSNHRHHHRDHNHSLSISSSSGATGTTITNSTTDHLSIHSAASSSKTSLSLSVSRSVSSLPRTYSQSPTKSNSPLSRSFRFRTTTSHSALNNHNRTSLASSSSTHSSGGGGGQNRLLTSVRATSQLHLARLSERSPSASTIAESSSRHADGGDGGGGGNSGGYAPWSHSADPVNSPLSICVSEEDGDLDVDDDDDPETTTQQSALRELHDIARRREELNARYLSRIEYLRARLKAAELHIKVMRR